MGKKNKKADNKVVEMDYCINQIKNFFKSTAEKPAEKAVDTTAKPAEKPVETTAKPAEKPVETTAKPAQETTAEIIDGEYISAPFNVGMQTINEKGELFDYFGNPITFNLHPVKFDAGKKEIQVWVPKTTQQQAQA